MNQYLIHLRRLTLAEYQSREFPCEELAMEFWQRAQLLPTEGFVIQQAQNAEQAIFLVNFERCGIGGDHEDYHINYEISPIQLSVPFLDYCEQSDDIILSLLTPDELQETD